MTTDKVARLLSIVQEIYDGGRDIIGPRWTLLDTMTSYADRGDVEGMRSYYDRCLASPKGRGVADRLRRNGRKTLESEHSRFLSICRSSE